MVSSLDAANVSLRTFQNGFSQGAAVLTGTFLDMVAVFKENPLLLFDPEVTNLTKALKDREQKIKKAITDERKIRAGMEKTVQDDKKIEEENKAFEKSEQAAARHELKLIEAQILGKEEAEKMKQAIEEKYAQRSLDRAIEMANRKAELMPQIEDLEAQRQGSGAEMKLLEERAAAASAQARISGGAEDVFNAQKLAVELQKSKEQAFNQAGFGDQSFSRAKASTEAIVGAIPQASQLRDIPSSTETQRTQPVRLENPPNLQGIMQKLDALIANAGVFS